jgi:hypothetical protein
MTNSLLKNALAYQKRNLSVIPVKPNKKSFIKWEEYQRRIAEPDEIRAWFKRWHDANIGIVTGKVSGNVGVIDIDDETGRHEINELLPDSYLTPVSETPSGGEHIYTVIPDGLSLSNNVRIIPGCDFRGEGGYVVAPPSKVAEGSYSWKQGLSLDDVAIAETPQAYIDRVAGRRQESLNINKSILYRGHDENVTKMFSDGTRDESLFHVANCLVKGGMPRYEISEVLETLMNSWGESHEEKWREDKIESAFKRAAIRDKSLAQEVREWVLSSFGVIYSAEFRSLRHLSSLEEQKNLSKILTRLCDEGLIQRYGNKSGCFRIIDTTEEEIDFLNCPTDCLDLKWPFEIERYVRIFRKNIVIIAGAPDSGKTAFLLNFVEMNMNSQQIFYFSSEMSGTEFKDRMSNFERKLDSWKVKLIERGSNFQDVIRPDAVNIIDFLEIHDDFYKVGGLIKDIYDRLDKGTAIIALQKNLNAPLGLGGYRSMEKARLYLSIEKHVLKMVKAKNWVNGEINPNDMELHFKIRNGCDFYTVRDWHKPVEEGSWKKGE